MCVNTVIVRAKKVFKARCVVKLDGISMTIESRIQIQCNRCHREIGIPWNLAVYVHNNNNGFGVPNSPKDAKRGASDPQRV